MYFDIKPEVKYFDLIKEYGFFSATKNFKNERDMWYAINDNYNLFLRNLGILKENSWVKYIRTETKAVVDDKTLNKKGVYVLHRLKLSDDISVDTFERHLKHLAEKFVLSVDYQVKENQKLIKKIGVKNYLKDKRRDPDYLQSTKAIKSVKEPMTRFRIFCENGDLCIKVFFEDMPIRYFKPIKPKPNQILMGMDTNYQPLWWDWSKDINIYLAGATGMGKTTIIHVFFINTLTYNLADIYAIDRKDSDLRPYANKKGVVAFGVDREEGAAVIQKFFDEWQRRKALLHEGDKDYLNYDEYNADHPEAPLRPYVLVIDEFADIAYECMKGGEIDIESPLGMILKEAAQIRNTGGHNLIATQRPSADILKGILKAQFSAQLGLRVINELNSTIVIDESGLQNLDRHCFKIRLEGKLIDGISYYLDTPMIKEYISKLPDRKKSDDYFDVKKDACEALIAKIAKAQQALQIAKDYIVQRQGECDRGLKNSSDNLRKANDKHEKAVANLEKLEKELEKLQKEM